jgi:hypothetical protein
MMPEVDTSTSERAQREKDGADLAGGGAVFDTHLTEAARTVGRRILDETRRRPGVALTVAMGVGFILGGGLATRVGRMTVLALAELALREHDGLRKALGHV